MKKSVETDVVREVRAQMQAGFEQASALGDLSAETHRAWSALLRSHAHWIERVEKRLSEAGLLSMEAYDVLLALSYAPESRLRIGELYGLVSVSRASVTRLVDQLEREGWVERRLCIGDRRSFLAVLTPAGEAERARCWPQYAEIVAQEFGRFVGQDDAKTLVRVLERPFQTDNSEEGA